MNRHLHSVPSGVAEDLAAQDAALDVDCPRCGAERDGYCVNPLTEHPIRRGVSHWQRVKAATTEETK